MKKILLGLLVLILIMGTCLFYGGRQYERQHTPPVIVDRIVEKRVDVPDVIVKTVIVKEEMPVEVEKIVNVPITLRDWDSVAQLKQFLAQDRTDKTVVSQTGYNGKEYYPCYTHATMLRDNALRAGFYLETEILTQEECYSFRDYVVCDPETTQKHDVCKARIKDEIWLVEPQSDSVWFAYNLN